MPLATIGEVQDRLRPIFGAAMSAKEWSDKLDDPNQREVFGRLLDGIGNRVAIFAAALNGDKEDANRLMVSDALLTIASMDYVDRLIAAVSGQAARSVVDAAMRRARNDVARKPRVATAARKARKR